MRRWAALARCGPAPARQPAAPRPARRIASAAARAQPSFQPAELAKGAACSTLAVIASMGVLLSGQPAAADMIEVRCRCDVASASHRLGLPSKRRPRQQLHAALLGALGARPANPTPHPHPSAAET